MSVQKSHKDSNFVAAFEGYCESYPIFTSRLFYYKARMSSEKVKEVALEGWQSAEVRSRVGQTMMTRGESLERGTKRLNIKYSLKALSNPISTFPLLVAALPHVC